MWRALTTCSRKVSLSLPLLLLLSGFRGISYEILYTKLLGNLLGNQFTINATVLLTFLLGIGLGTPSNVATTSAVPVAGSILVRLM